MDGKELYKTWIAKSKKINKITSPIKGGPSFAVVLFKDDADEKSTKQCLKSIEGQTYKNFKICKDSESVSDFDYCVLFSANDVMEENALYDIAKGAMRYPSAEFFYGDDDRFEGDMVDISTRDNPFFKPDWSPDTFLSLPYTGTLAAVKSDIAEKILSSIAAGDKKDTLKLYEVILQITDLCDNKKIVHIKSMLSHLRVRESLPEKCYNWQRKNEGLSEADAHPKVSIIIPSKDNVDMLITCMDSVFEYTDYPDYEIVLVDNGSSQNNKKRIESYISDKPVNYIYEPMAFNFSHMCNVGAKAAKGELFLFLNDDIVICQRNWMNILAFQALKVNAGGAGAKLYYPDSERIQHCGVIVNSGGPVHAFSLYEDDRDYYYGRNVLVYNYLIVTAACLMVRKSVFYEVGGFDEGLPVAYNDVDLCCKFYEHGYYNAVRNDVQLFHHESVSRGEDTMSAEKMERLTNERNMLYSKHKYCLTCDPFYHTALGCDRVDFLMDLYENVSETKETDFSYRWHRRQIGATSEDYVLSIDKLEERDGRVVVLGWTSPTDVKDKGIRKMSLLFRLLGGDFLEVSAERIIRMDAKIAMESDNEELGFYSVFPKELIYTNVADVGAVFYYDKERIVKWSGRRLELADEKISRKTCFESIAKADIKEVGAETSGTENSDKNYGAENSDKNGGVDNSNKSAAKDKHVEYNIEQFFVFGKHIDLKGYAYDSADKYNNRLLYFMRIISSNKSDVYTLKREARWDLANKQDAKNALYCGFAGHVDLDYKIEDDAKIEIILHEMDTHKNRKIPLR